MRNNPNITRLLDEANQECRLAFATSRPDCEAMRNRVRHHELVEPLPNCFTAAHAWAQLSPTDRTMRLARTVQEKYPTRIFAGVTAAVILGFWVGWGALDGTVHCTVPSGRVPGARNSPIVYHARRGASILTVDGLRVTDHIHTLIDCALTLPFCQALGIFDSALRFGVQPARILAECGRQRRDCSRVHRLLHHADPCSENGGESWVRATIIELGFARPQLQVELRDPQTGKCYRVDFLWVLPDGTLVVLEYDGLEKYTSERMKGGSSTAQRVVDERERDAALTRCGVVRIAHVFHRDVANRRRFMYVLSSLGVPTAIG